MVLPETEKRGGKDRRAMTYANTSHFWFGPQKWLFTLLGHIFGPDKNLRSPTGINNVYKTLAHSHTNGLIDSTLLSIICLGFLEKRARWTQRESDRQTDRQIFSNGLGSLSANSKLYGFIWGKRDPWLVPVSQLWSVIVAHTHNVSVCGTLLQQLKQSFKAYKRHCCFFLKATHPPKQSRSWLLYIWQEGV